MLPQNDSLAAAEGVPGLVRYMPLLAALIGIAVAYIFYIADPRLPVRLASQFRSLYLFLLNKWYFDELYDWLSRHRRPYRLQIVSRPKGETKFKPLPVRWVVERTYAWQGRYRCLSKDYEHTPEASEAMIRIAAAHHLLQRLRPKGRPYSQRFRFKKPRKTVG